NAGRRDIDRGEPGPLGQMSGQGIVDAGRDEDRRGGKAGAQGRISQGRISHASHSKVSTLEFGVRTDVLRKARHDKFSFSQNVGAVRDLEALNDVLLYQQN